MYIIFLLSTLKHRLWVLVRTAHTLPVLSKTKKNFTIFRVKIFTFTPNEIASMSCLPNRFQPSVLGLTYRRGSYNASS